MSAHTSTSTSNPNFATIFNTALNSYKRKTKKDLNSHPLLPRLQSCDSPEAILTLLGEQIQESNQPRDGDDSLTKWVSPTVNVLYAFSATVGQGVGLVFPPVNAIFAGISVLLVAAKDTKSCREKITNIFNRIEHFFRRLEIYTVLSPTAAMTDVIVDIMVEVLTILAIATKDVKREPLKRYLKKLAGNRDIEDSLERLDNLTQEEARMASTELLKITHSVDGKMLAVDDRVKGVDGKMQDVRDDMQKIRDDVQDIGNKVQDVRVDMKDVRDKVQDVDIGVQDIGKDFYIRVQALEDKFHQANRNQLRDNLLRWLSPPDPSTNHNIAWKAHHNGTAEWFFRSNIFSQWKSTSPFLWIHGKPGSGKSVLCSSIIQDITDLRDAGKALVAYFYFDFRDVDKQTLQNLLPSLLTQLSARSDPCRDILYQLYCAHDRGERKPTDREMVECLKEMLILGGQAPTFMVFDALDECPITSSIPSAREEVLELVNELVSLYLPNVHICVTSRPEHDIRAVLECLSERSVSLHDETGQQEDISKFVSSFVRSSQGMKRWRDEDKNLIIKLLSEKADGMFRWVFCQLELLRHCFPPSVRRILDELPEGLDETYERILREIRRPNRGHAHRLLQCLVAAVRPLQVKELAEVLAFDFNTEGIPKLNPGWRWEDQQEAVMSACSSLVIIVKHGDSRVVQFSHFSVKEFLTADRLAEPIRDVSRYHIRLDAAHTILVRACLGVLLQLGDRIDRDSMKSFPLARYAALDWATHARIEDVSSRIKDGMELLFDADKPHFATWLWIYNVDRWGRSMLTMRPEKPEAVPLYYAAMLGFRDLAQHFIARHSHHVTIKGGPEVTPLHVAALEGHSDILFLLIEHGADVNGRGRYGDTPLHRASEKARLEAGRLLLDHGAEVEAQNVYNNTALVYTAVLGHAEFARMLLERGAKVDIRGRHGRTPLHWAAESGQTEVVRLFLEHGADAHVCDEDGCTPFDFASKMGYHEIVGLLSELHPSIK